MLKLNELEKSNVTLEGNINELSQQLTLAHNEIDMLTQQVKYCETNFLLFLNQITL